MLGEKKQRNFNKRTLFHT